jgi:ferrochelatase
VEQLAGRGVKRLGVACPSFVADCLETLEEIGLDNQELFHEHGGKDYLLAPCPNADPEWVQGFADWLRPLMHAGS